MIFKTLKISLTMLALVLSIKVQSDERKIIQIKDADGNKIPVWSTYGINNDKFQDEWGGEDPAGTTKVGTLKPNKPYIVNEAKVEDVYFFGENPEKPIIYKETFYRITYNSYREGWVSSRDLQKMAIEEVICPDDQSLDSEIADIARSVHQPVKVKGAKGAKEFEQYLKKHICSQPDANSKEACDRFEIFKGVVAEAAAAYDLPFSALACIATRESRWDKDADAFKIENVKNGSQNPLNYAWGLNQAKIIAAEDTRQRLIGKINHPEREGYLQERWEAYLSNVSENQLRVPGVKATLNYANIEALKKDSEYFTNYETLILNTPLNIGISAVQLRAKLWSFGVKEGQKPTIDQLLMAFAAYNRGAGELAKVCENQTASQCFENTRFECKKNYQNKKTGGWYEGHRYVASLRRCMTEGSFETYDIPTGECP